MFIINNTKGTLIRTVPAGYPVAQYITAIGCDFPNIQVLDLDKCDMYLLHWLPLDEKYDEVERLNVLSDDMWGHLFDHGWTAAELDAWGVTPPKWYRELFA